MRICKRELKYGTYDRRHSSFAMSENGVVPVAPNGIGNFDDDDDDEDDEESVSDDADEGGIPRSRGAEEDEGVELRTFSTSFDEGNEDDFVGAGPGHVAKERELPVPTSETGERKI